MQAFADQLNVQPISKYDEAAGTSGSKPTAPTAIYLQLYVPASCLFPTVYIWRFTCKARRWHQHHVDGLEQAMHTVTRDRTLSSAPS